MMIWVLMAAMGIMWTLYGNIATFYPPYVEAHHKTISSFMVGVVLAMYEIGILITSPLVSLLMPRVGRKNFILFGNVCMIGACAGFGLLVYIKNDIVFFVASVLLRMIMGLGDSTASTAIFSIIGSEYPDKRDEYFGYFEAAVGLGLMAGPIIG